MKTLKITNRFHNSEVTLKPRADGTISARTYIRALRTLCGNPGCRCFGQPHVDGMLTHAEPIYATAAGRGAVVVAFRLGGLL